jgi:hypothetical protein
MSHAPLALQPLDALRLMRRPLEPETIHITLTFPAALDPDTLDDALAHLAGHFPVLGHGAKPRQSVWTPAENNVRNLRVIKVDSGESLTRACEHAQSLAVDVEAGPALAPTLIQCEYEGAITNSALVLAISHVATDLEGALETAELLAAIYTALAQGLRPDIAVTADRSLSLAEGGAGAAEKMRLRADVEREYHPSRELVAPVPHTTHTEPGVVWSALAPSGLSACVEAVDGLTPNMLLATLLGRQVARMLTRDLVRIPVFQNLRRFCEEPVGPANLGSYVMVDVAADTDIKSGAAGVRNAVLGQDPKQALAWPLQASLAWHTLGYDGLAGVAYDTCADPLVSLEHGGFFSKSDFAFAGAVPVVEWANTPHIWPHVELSSVVLEGILHLSIAYLGDANTRAFMQHVVDGCVNDLIELENA